MERLSAVVAAAAAQWAASITFLQALETFLQFRSALADLKTIRGSQTLDLRRLQLAKVRWATLARTHLAQRLARAVFLDHQSEAAQQKAVMAELAKTHRMAAVAVAVVPLAHLEPVRTVELAHLRAAVAVVAQMEAHHRQDRPHLETQLALAVTARAGLEAALAASLALLARLAAAVAAEPEHRHLTQTAALAA